MHTGVDWSCAVGTPIMAAGNGVIEEVGRKGEYGNYIRIRHANGYKTAYGHMSRFASGVTAGVKVRQGQIIGFVGSTGLASGPHVHFEVRSTAASSTRCRSRCRASASSLASSSPTSRRRGPGSTT